MRKTMIAFLAYILCMWCFIGICQANDAKDGNWVQYYYENLDENNGRNHFFYYIDADSVGVIEYDGHKYLKAKTMRKKELWADFNAVSLPYHRKDMEFCTAYDLMNQRGVDLEWWYKHKEWSGSKNKNKGTSDISEIVNGWTFNENSARAKAVDWVKENRPEIIAEITGYDKQSSGLEMDSKVDSEVYEDLISNPPSVGESQLKQAFHSDLIPALAQLIGDYEVIKSNLVTSNQGDGTGKGGHEIGVGTIINIREYEDYMLGAGVAGYVKKPSPESMFEEGDGFFTINYDRVAHGSEIDFKGPNTQIGYFISITIMYTHGDEYDYIGPLESQKYPVIMFDGRILSIVNLTDVEYDTDHGWWGTKGVTIPITNRHKKILYELRKL